MAQNDKFNQAAGNKDSQKSQQSSGDRTTSSQVPQKDMPSRQSSTDSSFQSGKNQSTKK